MELPEAFVRELLVEAETMNITIHEEYHKPDDAEEPDCLPGPFKELRRILTEEVKPA